ncbi:MAG: OmpA family protein [Microscillaceae bacterium]|nr:OmpA family protein [Microscillaceae bacterium]
MIRAIAMKISSRALLHVLIWSYVSILTAQNKVIESESPVYKNLGIDQIMLHLTVRDAETLETLCFYIQAEDSLNHGIVFQADSSSKILIREVPLPISGIYKLHIKAHGYNDTLLIVNLTKIENYQLQKETFLSPKRTEVEITIRDIDKDEFLNMDVLVRNRDRKEQIELHPEDARDNKYTVRLREEDEYEVEVKNPEGLIFYTNNLIDPKTMKDKKLEVQVLTELKPNSKVRLYGITFASRATDLDENARNELNRVADLLQSYPTAKLEIAAHTDSLGSLAFNMELSRKRAAVVYEYLVAKGIKPQNLLKKGYGPTRPVASNDTEEGRSKNRRFELIVLSL